MAVAGGGCLRIPYAAPKDSAASESPGSSLARLVAQKVALGLRSKPVPVSSASAVLVLDFWPLNRLPPREAPNARTPPQRANPY